MALTRVEPAGGLNAGINTTVYTAVGIESGGNFVGVGVTLLNFIGAGNTFLNRGNGVVDISVDSGAASDAVVKENFTVTSNTQTVFTLTQAWKSGLLDVYVNGLKLAESDFTSQVSNRQVTLVVAAQKGDTVEFIAFREKVVNTVINTEVQNFEVTGLSTYHNMIVSGIATFTQGLHNEKKHSTQGDWILESTIRKIVGTSATVAATSGNIMFTKYQEVELDSNVILEISNGSSLVLDAYQFS